MFAVFAEAVGWPVRCCCLVNCCLCVEILRALSAATGMESVQVEVKIELGHKASCKKILSPEGFTHDWVVFVRGPESCDISHFVEKVVFYLHESFAKPKRGKGKNICQVDPPSLGVRVKISLRVYHSVVQVDLHT